MTREGWSLVAIAAQLLPRREREAALGDLAEASESAWQGLTDVLSLVLRRQAILWKSWRPWLAAFGLTVPNSFPLMGTSVSVSQTFLRLAGHKVPDAGRLTTMHDLVYLQCQVFLLLACSWAGGFVAASVSRRTIWVSASLCALPCLFCFATFRIESLSRVSLLLFLLPAVLGVRRGLGNARIKLTFAIALALAITMLMAAISGGGGLRVLSWALLWPAWYLVAAALESGNQAEPT
jgi:putative effector of murein hydrolase LrgA (UPF0299 family)